MAPFQSFWRPFATQRICASWELIGGDVNLPPQRIRHSLSWSVALGAFALGALLVVLASHSVRRLRPSAAFAAIANAPEEESLWSLGFDLDVFGGSRERGHVTDGVASEHALTNFEEDPGVDLNFWMMCPSGGTCGQHSLQRWKTNPKHLTSAVDRNLANLPSLPADVYRPVADHWSESPPVFGGDAVPLSEVSAFLKDLLVSDPFGTDDSVPYVDFQAQREETVVAITQRQLAFIVANVLMGNSIPAGDGLSAALTRCSKMSSKPTGFVYSLLSFLAVLSRELASGAQGRQLIAGTPRREDGSWRDRLATTDLAEPVLCGAGEECGLSDFMAGGTPFQALTDIAGAVVGGGSQLCDIADSQDESLAQFYSEVLAFSFFTKAEGRPEGAEQMLPVPWVLLGASRYMSNIGGESSSGAPFFNSCGTITETDWLNEQRPSATLEVELKGRRVSITAAAFVAVASKCSATAGDCEMSDAVNNNCDSQRRHLDEDIGLWYQAFEPTMYNSVIQSAFSGVVRRIGTGPWGAGVWYGDSQHYFLTVWLATSLLGGLHHSVLDYYIYDHFCENPGNQCFVLGAERCKACITRSGVAGGLLHESRCGSVGVQSVISRFQGRRTKELYDKLLGIAGPPDQVFDLIDSPDGGEPIISMLPSEAVPAPSTQDAPRRASEATGTMFGKFKFAGFGARTEAEKMCGSWHLARPKTAEDHRALKAAVTLGVQAGIISIKWPRNRLWLGGQWRPTAKRWEWDDGDPVSSEAMDWEVGEPNGAKPDQAAEPYLYMTASSGKFHDYDDPHHIAGIFCEES